MTTEYPRQEESFRTLLQTGGGREEPKQTTLMQQEVLKTGVKVSEANKTQRTPTEIMHKTM